MRRLLRAQIARHLRAFAAYHGECGQPWSDGPTPVVVDALGVLRTAVGLEACGREVDSCACDVDGSGVTTSAGSLALLRRTVRTFTVLACKDGCSSRSAGLGPTSSTSSTTTTATTLWSPTTTLFDSVNTVGADLYAARCGGCHSMGSYDPSGFAGDLQGAGKRLVNKLAALSPSMTGIALTNSARDAASRRGLYCVPSLEPPAPAPSRALSATRVDIPRIQGSLGPDSRESAPGSAWC